MVVIMSKFQNKSNIFPKFIGVMFYI